MARNPSEFGIRFGFNRLSSDLFTLYIIRIQPGFQLVENVQNIQSICHYMDKDGNEADKPNLFEISATFFVTSQMNT